MLESRFSQLRFDISEKVCLHPQNPGMDTLLELDLYPDVNIKDEGHHLKIQGYLRLNGSYLSESDSEVAGQDAYADARLEENRHELAYVIPVEITLPADRAEQGSISAEVETFDYQLLSPFELQIEAILLIDGLLPDHNVEEDHSETEELPEGLVFSGRSARPLSNEEEEIPQGREEAVSMIQSEDASHKHEDKPEKSLGSTEQQETPPSSQKEKKDFSSAVPQESKRVEEKETVRKATENTPVEEPGIKKVEQPSEEPVKEKMEEPVSAFVPSPRDFWKERQESKKESHLNETESNDVSQEEDGDPAEKSSHGGTQWVGWLIKGENETFTPMKMVIVQRDETIDHLASRYQVSVETILESNNLKMDRLEEGQILYVPIVDHQTDHQTG